MLLKRSESITGSDPFVFMDVKNGRPGYKFVLDGYRVGFAVTHKYKISNAYTYDFFLLLSFYDNERFVSCNQRGVEVFNLML